MACIREESCGGTAACYGCAGYEQEDDTREVRNTCDGCGKNLYEGDTYWGNNQIGSFCEECAEKEIEQWWGTIW